LVPPPVFESAGQDRPISDGRPAVLDHEERNVGGDALQRGREDGACVREEHNVWGQDRLSPNQRRGQNDRPFLDRFIRSLKLIRISSFPSFLFRTQGCNLLSFPSDIQVGQPQPVKRLVSERTYTHVTFDPPSQHLVAAGLFSVPFEIFDEDENRVEHKSRSCFLPHLFSRFWNLKANEVFAFPFPDDPKLLPLSERSSLELINFATSEIIDGFVSPSCKPLSPVQPSLNLNRIKSFSDTSSPTTRPSSPSNPSTSRRSPFLQVERTISLSERVSHVEKTCPSEEQFVFLPSLLRSL
jgi:hypothetical protein